MSSAPSDPLLVSARREALVTLAVFLVAMTYTIVYCSLFGFDRSAESLTFVLGFPDWVFWGVIVPWGCCTAISLWFSYFFMQDIDLGPELDPARAETFDLPLEDEPVE